MVVTGRVQPAEPRIFTIRPSIEKDFQPLYVGSLEIQNHNTKRLDINYKKKTVKNTNTWRLNNTFLNNRLLKKSKGK